MANQIGIPGSRRCTPIAIVLWTLIFVLIAGCVRFNVYNESFPTSKQALARQKEILRGWLDTVDPAATSLHGEVVIALPSRDFIEKYVIPKNAAVSGEQMNFMVAVVGNMQDMMADAIRKRRLFSQITLVRSSDPISVPIGENEFLIFVDVDGWFIKGKTVNSPKKLVSDSAKSPGAPRLVSFLDTIDLLAKEMENQR